MKKYIIAFIIIVVIVFIIYYRNKNSVPPEVAEKIKEDLKKKNDIKALQRADIRSENLKKAIETGNAKEIERAQKALNARLSINAKKGLI